MTERKKYTEQFKDEVVELPQGDLERSPLTTVLRDNLTS